MSTHTIEKQGIMNLTSYSSKSYASIVLNDSEVAFRSFIVFYLYSVA